MCIVLTPDLSHMDRVSIKTAAACLRWYEQHAPENIKPFIAGAWVDDSNIYWERDREFWGE